MLRSLVLLLLVCVSGMPALVAGDAEAEDFRGEAPTLSLEMLGRGLLPVVRVLVTASPRGTRQKIPRTWSYQIRRLSDVGTGNLPSHTEEIATMRLSADRIFTSSPTEDDITILPGRVWGHDHVLDLRPAHAKPGMVGIRLMIGDQTSPWIRYQIPDVPLDLPLVQVGSDARKFDAEHFANLAIREKARIVRGTLESGDHPWTRILTIDPADPLAPLLPRLLIDGKTHHLIEDGQRCRFALTHVFEGGTVEDGAMLIGVQPER